MTASRSGVAVPATISRGTTNEPSAELSVVWVWNMEREGLSDVRREGAERAMKSSPTLAQELRIRRILAAIVRVEHSQKAAAKRLGVSAQHLNDVLNVRRALSPKILCALGYERVVCYRKVAR